jgi:membrane protein implicated in regulation of membrane protease activity
LIGQTAYTLTAIEPGLVGRVSIRGESWRAVATEAIPQGAPVRVMSIDGLTLVVRKD